MAEGRIASLDVLRGVAILGTFASNAWIFADPAGPVSVISGHCSSRTWWGAATGRCGPRPVLPAVARRDPADRPVRDRAVPRRVPAAARRRLRAHGGGRTDPWPTLLGLGVGASLNLLAAYAGPDWFLVDRYLLPPLVALGLLGLVTSLLLRYRGGRVRSGIAAVGRTALSCYVLQNVLGGVACYDWGLGLAARFADARPWWVVGLWAGVSAVLVPAATAWLRRFDRGPLELVLHRLYDRRPVPAQ